MLGWLATNAARTPLTTVLEEKGAKALKSKLGIATVGDLLTTLPGRYVAQGGMSGFREEDLGELITAVVTVKSIRDLKEHADGSPRLFAGTPKRLPVVIVATDGVRDVQIPLFGASWITRAVYPDMRLLAMGTLDWFNGRLQFRNADVMVVQRDGTPGVATGRLKDLIKGADGMAEIKRLLARPYLPIHRGKKGVAGVLMALYANRALRWLPRQPEPLPRTPEGLLSFDEALRQAHFPGIDGPMPALQRLKYDEALELQLALALRRAANATREAPPCPPVDGGAADALRAGLPFTLTRGQGQVLGDVSADIARDRPMNRLLQGEVGSGKTVVALLAMLQAHDNGRQSALLAPTEVLAAQHARTITAQLSDAGVDVGVTLLTGSMTANAKRKAMLDIVTGESGIVVGTHALLSEGVEFFDLGLVVIDEQHRFGVRQRDRLRDRAREGFTPHVLVMTATPIPRTLAMTVFGDLDVSALTEIPAERAEITTVVVPGAQKPHWEERAWERIREEVEAGNRAFIVSPRILGDGESVEDNFDLARRKLPGVAVGFVHGQMSSEEKTAAMADFAEGRTDVLVATTVVEVGVNIPEATVMMIRRAESYGVSQLHQLRGRVGRGDRPGLCFLCTDTAPGTPERERLEAIAATNDGFVLADIDVRVRKHGDVLGEDQSGLSGGLGLLDLGNDREIIERARRDAAILAAEDPDLARALTRDITEEEAGYLDRA